MEILPGQLEFKGTFTKPSTEYLTLKNPTNTPLAFKVKTTAPKLYCVRPNASIVAPGDSVQIQIILQAFTTPLAPDFKCKDKFLIVSLPSSDFSDASKVADHWSSLEAKLKDSVVSKKLRVNYVVTKEDVTNESSAPSTGAAANGKSIETPSKSATSYPNPATPADFHSTAPGPDTPFNQLSNNYASQQQTPYVNPVPEVKEVSSPHQQYHQQPQQSYNQPQQSPYQQQQQPQQTFQQQLPVQQQYQQQQYQQSPPQQQYMQSSPSVPQYSQEKVASPGSVAPPPQQYVSEPVNGISMPFAAILCLISFLIGWLIF